MLDIIRPLIQCALPLDQNCSMGRIDFRAAGHHYVQREVLALVSHWRTALVPCGAIIHPWVGAVAICNGIDFGTISNKTRLPHHFKLLWLTVVVESSRRTLSR